MSKIAPRSETTLRLPSRYARAFAGLPALVLLVSVGGCSTWSAWRAADQPQNQPVATTSEFAGDFSRTRLIVQNLVNAMVQIPELAPATTVLHTLRPESRFGELLLMALQGAGYDLRLGKSSGGLSLNYKVERDPAYAHDASYRFELSAGPVSLRRSYRSSADGVQPVSALFLKGVPAAVVDVDDSIFGTAQGMTATGWRPVAQSEPVRAPQTVAALIPSPAPLPAPAQLPTTGQRNLYVTRQSNFEQELAAYRTVNRFTMIFANDSLVMGQRNKRLAREMASEFDTRTDIVSVIGCSHGRTALDNGNERLATGRALRVRDEFMRLGIDEAQIYDEGCWASVHFDEEMPRRGVVVTHKRSR